MAVKRFLAAVSVVLAVLPVASSAFDGERKGIVLGGGVGLSPMARWSTELASESKFGVGLHFFAGYAWDEQNMIGYENNGTVYHSDYYNSDSLVGSGDLLTAQGFQGASWYHYWGQRARAFFTAVGLGLCEFSRGEGYHSDPGGAYLLGAGYQFTRRLQAGFYFSAGRTADAGPDFAHRHLSLLVSGMVF
jgi:hypothetical protein